MKIALIALLAVILCVLWTLLVGWFSVAAYYGVHPTAAALQSAQEAHRREQLVFFSGLGVIITSAVILGTRLIKRPDVPH